MSNSSLSNGLLRPSLDRKSTRLNSSHQLISYAVFSLKKKMISPPASQLIRHFLSPQLARNAQVPASWLFLPPASLLSGYFGSPHLAMNFFFFNDTATTEIYTLSLHDALPIFFRRGAGGRFDGEHERGLCRSERDRKSTRLNSSHQLISYAVFCLKKKKKHFMEPNEQGSLPDVIYVLINLLLR